MIEKRLIAFLSPAPKNPNLDSTSEIGNQQPAVEKLSFSTHISIFWMCLCKNAFSVHIKFLPDTSFSSSLLSQSHMKQEERWQAKPLMIWGIIPAQEMHSENKPKMSSSSYFIISGHLCFKVHKTEIIAAVQINQHSIPTLLYDNWFSSNPRL